MKLKLFALAVLIFCFGCQNQPEQTSENIPPNQPNEIPVTAEEQKLISAIEPFFKPMGEPQPYDWLTTFHEDGQTFAQYKNSNPTLPTSERKIIYIQPIGKFKQDQNQVIEATAEYMRAFFQLEVKVLETKPLEEPLSMKHYRINPNSHKRQIRTGYFLDELLPKMLPKDATAIIAFTNEDLFPNETMNYVFGQASLQNRVGVWSLYRFSQDADYKTFLTRTLKVGVHETGHMFSIQHCTKYQCVMSGTNHLGETDRRPIDACPEDTAKIIWMNKISPAKRYKDLAEFCRKYNLTKDAEMFEKKAVAVDFKLP
jgi:archaemetzincin